MTIITLKLGAVEMLGLAAFGLIMGAWLKRRIRILDRLNIPASIAGGMVYAVLTLVLHDRWLNFEFDTVLRDLLMMAFFATIGFNASLQLLRIGGVQVVIFLLAAVVGLVFQIFLGVGLAKWLGLDPLVGLIPGAVSLTGGPATALAFGAAFEDAGVHGATALAVGAAMFGITAGGLMGAFIGATLIRRNDLVPVAGADACATAPESATIDTRLESGGWSDTVLLLGLALGLGSLVNKGFQMLGITMPASIGPMLCGAVLRNLDDWSGPVWIAPQRMDTLGTIALELFIVMALISLRLWEIANLAVPVFLILCAQIVLLVVLCWSLIFKLMGGDYQSAVMATGYYGFMMGTTANAMACMNELVRKYGPAPHAFFVVTIVGAFLIDFINAVLITVSINLLR